MSVEWLRSCYKSRWFLVHGGTGANVSGRYYFSPANTPFYPAPTLLTSRGWHDSNALIVQSLGEDLLAKQVYDNGEMPALLPQNVSVGSAACLIDGEPLANATTANQLVNGFPGECFIIPPTGVDPWNSFSDHQSCAIQLACAKIIEWLYLGETARISALVGQLLGPAYGLTYIPGTAIYPDVFLAVSADDTFVWVDGTTNFQQLALSVCYGLIPPTNIGIFSTSPYWYAVSTYLHAQITSAGANPTGPIFFAGHSLGGVASLILAARYRAGIPERRIRYLTYGCPKVGDTRLTAFVRRCQGWSFVNNYDLVPMLPADELIVAALIALLGAPVLLAWTFWERAQNQMQMDEAGIIIPDTLPTLDFPTAVVIATKVLASLPVATIDDHLIHEYFKRIALRCPLPDWPLTAADYLLIFAP